MQKKLKHFVSDFRFPGTISFIFLILFLTGLNPCLNAQKLFIKRYTAVNGLAQDQVFSVCQDHLGFIWFGTAAGLSKYDGHRFTNYTKQQGLLSNVIRKIYQTSDRLLWLATDEGVNRYDLYNDTFVSYSYKNGIGRGTVWDVLEDHDGNIWFATGNGLSVLIREDQSVKTYTVNDGLPSNVIYSLAMDNKQTIYAGTLQGLAALTFKSNRTLSLKNITVKEGLINDRIVSLLWENDRLWAGTPFGLTLIDNGVFSSYTMKQGLSFNSIRCFYRDRQGDIWLATEGGITRITYREARLYFASYYSHHGFGTNQFYSVMQDREDNYWFGSFSDGVCKLMSEEFISYNMEDGLPNKTILTIKPYGERQFLIGTFEGLCVFDGRSFRTYKSEDGLISSVIWDVGIDSSGLIWIATYNGVQILIPKNYFQERPGLSDTQVRKIKRLISQSFRMNEFYVVDLSFISIIRNVSMSDVFIDSRNRVWLGSRDNGIFRFEMDETGDIICRQYTTEQGLKSPSSWRIYEDRQGRIWSGLIGGGIALYHEASDRFNCFTVDNGLTDNLALSMQEDKEGYLWIGTEIGMTRLDIRKIPVQASYAKFDLGGLIKNFTKTDGLPDNNINAIEIDADGFLWIGTNNGLVRFDPAQQKIENIFNSRSGLIKNEISTHNSLWIDGRKRILIGTSAGLSVMPMEIRKSERPDNFPVYLTEVLIENKYQKVTRKIGWHQLNKSLGNGEQKNGGRKDHRPLMELLFEESIITFEFVSPSYRDESDVKYKYRLLGFEKEWSDPTPENKIRYTNLDDGDYVFEVAAGGMNRKWNEEPLSLYFRIQTPFWKSWWFIAFVLMLVLFSAYTLYQFRVSMVEKRNKALEEHVQVRTRQLMKEKEKVESILQELKETQTQLVHNEKMASLGQLVAGIAHEINNPITFIKGNIYVLERKIEEITRLFNFLNDLNTYHVRMQDVKAEADDTVIHKLTEINKWFKTNNVVKFVDDLPKIIVEMKEGVERTRKIVDNLKEFSRSNESDFKDVTLNDNIESTLNILKSEYKNRIEIHRDFSELPPVFCNPGHINQVLMNLLTNAFQSIPDKGNVWIKTTAGQNNILISIRDNGSGIPYDVQHRIFDPFFTTKPVGKGTGLGLSISYKIIENHKGTIYFESHPGKGTEFKITLPIRRRGQDVDAKII